MWISSLYRIGPMCMIIDTNRINDFLNHPSQEDIKPIHDWLKRKGRIVYSTGDQFSTELKDKARRRLEDYARIGRSSFVSDDRVVVEAEKLRSSGLSFKSNDHHVLALARISKARLLYSSDEGLHEDFKNTEIIPSPKGHIYQDKKHRKLLNDTVCGRSRSRR